MPTNLLATDETEKIVPGYSLLSKPQQAELAYRLACDKRLDDVLGYIESVSRGTASLDISRLHGVLGEIRDLGGERTDGLVRIATIKAKRGEPSETEQSQLARMDEDQRRRLVAASHSPLYANKYEAEAVALQDAVDKKTTQLLAVPHAYAQVKSRYGAAYAQRAFAWAGAGAGANSDGGGGG